MLVTLTTKQIEKFKNENINQPINVYLKQVIEDHVASLD